VALFPGTAVDVPVHVVAAAKSTAAITSMQIYLDNKLIFHSPDKHVD
jgi:hypothetical protein